jgi:hypothetical protein
MDVSPVIVLESGNHDQGVGNAGSFEGCEGESVPGLSLWLVNDCLLPLFFTSCLQHFRPQFLPVIRAPSHSGLGPNLMTSL